MMDIEKIIKLLGLPIESPEIIEFFQENGIDGSRFKIPSDESYTHCEMKSEGYELVLSSEAHFLGVGDKPSNYGRLYLTNVSLYGIEINGYSIYSGGIPKGLSLGCTRGKTHTILGEPTWVSFKNKKGLSPFERWDNQGDYYIHASYSEDTDLLAKIGIGKPTKELS